MIKLTQLPIPPLGPDPIVGNVPLAAGYLKLAAMRRGLAAAESIEIVPARLANLWGDRAFARNLAAGAPEIVGFTTYLWNIDRTLHLARELKRLSPRTRIVIGGPEITFDNRWVMDTDVWDALVVGEGEQTFVEYLEALDDPDRPIPGLIRAERRQAPFTARTPMANLDPISSPYLAGILDAADQDHLLLETIRGCIFNCRFCYYPKSYDRLYYVSDEKIVANLEHARAAGAREVFLLDPTLNQRRDFGAFLDLLAGANADGAFEFHAELRAEGLKPEHARRMREAGFKNVEIGLQSIDPLAQELMDRRNNLRAFEAGIRAMQKEGVTTKVDLIVGLPGDTEDSIRRGMHYLAENRLYDEIQVFQLSVLPGTEFRMNAQALGIEFQDRPPYYVTRTKTLDLEKMKALLAEAEEVFDIAFDALPAPVLRPLAGESNTAREVRIDLTRGEEFRLPPAIAHAFVLRFRTADPWRDRERIGDAIRAVIAADPFTTLQLVIETESEFPLDALDLWRAASARRESNYLDRFYAFTPLANAGAYRPILLLPAAKRRRFDRSWLDAVTEVAEIAWIDGDGTAPLIPARTAGEWRMGRRAARR